MTLSDTELVSNGIDTINSVEVVNLIGGNVNNTINASQTTQVNTIINALGGNDLCKRGRRRRLDYW